MISWFRVLYPIFVWRFQAIMLYFDDTLDDEDDLMIFDELEVKLTAVNFVRVNTTFPQNFGRQRVYNLRYMSRTKMHANCDRTNKLVLVFVVVLASKPLHYSGKQSS